MSVNVDIWRYRLLLRATCDEGGVALVVRCDSQPGGEDDAGALAKPYALIRP